MMVAALGVLDEAGASTVGCYLQLAIDAAEAEHETEPRSDDE